MIRERDVIILATDLPLNGLRSGDIGAVVMVHHDPMGSASGYEVEFVTLDGATVAVVSLLPSQVRPVGRWEIAHARPVRMSV